MDAKKKTRVISVDGRFPQPKVINFAAREILHGKLVAFPTETVYGLGANALDEIAVNKIFIAKNRPFQDPLIVHIGSITDLHLLVNDIPVDVYMLADVFWPGPLTFVLFKNERVPNNVTAGLDKIAVRMPAHPVALALLRSCRVPIAAPSANCFGKISPTTAKHVIDDLDGSIDLVLDGGSTTIGLESTVLDMTCTPPRILRPGGISKEDLEKVLGPLTVHDGRQSIEGGDAEETPQCSPGMLSKHYAPRAELILITIPNTKSALKKMRQLSKTKICEGRIVGLLLADEEKCFFADLDLQIITIGSQLQKESIAKNLYSGLRELDEKGVDLILAHDFGKEGLGLAINDRLRRASNIIIDK